MTDLERRRVERALAAEPDDHATAVRAMAHRLRIEPPCDTCGGRGWLATFAASGGTGVSVTIRPDPQPAENGAAPGTTQEVVTADRKLQCYTCAGENGAGTGSILRGRLELAAWCGSQLAKDVLGWERGTPLLVSDGRLVPLPFDGWLHSLLKWNDEARARAAHAAGMAALEEAPPEEQDDGIQAPDSPTRLALDACLAWIEKRGSWVEWLNLTHESRVWPAAIAPCAEIVSPPHGMRSRRDACTAEPSIRAAVRVLSEGHVRAAISRALIPWALRP